MKGAYKHNKVGSFSGKKNVWAIAVPFLNHTVLKNTNLIVKERTGPCQGKPGNSSPLNKTIARQIMSGYVTKG
jgi:hypothetical protein